MKVKIIESNSKPQQVRVVMDKPADKLTARYVEGHWKGEKKKIKTWVVSGHNAMHASNHRLLYGLGIYDKNVLYYMTRFSKRRVCGGDFVVDCVLETLEG